MQELCELTISTYKHVSRLRFARLVGFELGKFYCSMDMPHKAISFFTDLLRELKTENWNFLASQILLESAKCYESMGDMISYTKTCASVACCLDLDINTRLTHFEEHVKSLAAITDDLEENESAETQNKFVMLEDHFRFEEIVVRNTGQIVQVLIVLLFCAINSMNK